MNILKRTAAATGFAAIILLGACATNDSTTTNEDYGRVDAAATTGSVEGTSTTPAVIPGPAKVDSDGNVYTSSAAPATGNASAIGTNTNVNIVPPKPEARVAVTYTPIEPEPVAVIVEAPPAPVVVVETVVETPTMVSSTEETTRVRMSKD